MDVRSCRDAGDYALVSSLQRDPVLNLVQPLLVVADTGLHQQTGDTALHLHHLLDHQVPVS